MKGGEKEKNSNYSDYDLFKKCPLHPYGGLFKSVIFSATNSFSSFSLFHLGDCDLWWWKGISEQGIEWGSIQMEISLLFFLGHTHVQFPEQTDRNGTLNGVVVDLLCMTSSNNKKVRIQWTCIAFLSSLCLSNCDDAKRCQFKYRRRDLFVYVQVHLKVVFLLGSKLSVPRLCYFFDIFVLQTISVTPRRKISAKGTKFLCQTRGFSLAAVSTPRTFQAKPKKPPRSNSNNKEKGGDGKGQKVMGLHGLWRWPRDKSANGPKGEEESIDAGHKYKIFFWRRRAGTVVVWDNFVLPRG